jgi:pimeloyl-ACP methyl ester carboxylesterase
MIRETVELQGQKLSLVRTSGSAGASTRPLVLFCHGNSSSASSFAPLLAGSLGHTHRTVALDWPGHGESANASDPAAYTIPSFARVVEGVLSHLRAERYVLVGHSLGGHVLSEGLPTLHGALGLMLVSAPPLDRAAMDRIFQPDPTGGAMFQGAADEAQVTAFAQCLAAPERVSAATFTQLKRDIQRTDALFRPSLLQSLGRGEFGGEAVAVAQTNAPVAICFGRHDPFLHAAYYGEARVPTLWRGRLCEFEETGHSPHLEATARFEETLRAFLSDVAGDGAQAA